LAHEKVPRLQDTFPAEPADADSVLASLRNIPCSIKARKRGKARPGAGEASRQGKAREAEEQGAMGKGGTDSL
jgi:hypothetical protein